MAKSKTSGVAPDTGEKFSEYTFAFAASSEILTEVFPPGGSILPFFPSLRAERYLGYDLRLPLPNSASPLCLQYKIVTPVKRIGFQSQLTLPCFKFKINREQNKTLTKQTLKKLNVYYCAPLFCTVSEIESHFANQSILDNSIFMPPPQWPDSAAFHKLIVDKSCVAYLCSEPELIEGIYQYQEIRSRLNDQRQNMQELLATTHELLSTSHDLSGPVWTMFEQELSWINELPQGDYRAALKSFWRYRWIRVLLALNYGLDFHLVS